MIIFRYDCTTKFIQLIPWWFNYTVLRNSELNMLLWFRIATTCHCGAIPNICGEKYISLAVLAQHTGTIYRDWHRDRKTHVFSKMGGAGTDMVVDFGTPWHTVYPYHSTTGIHRYIILRWACIFPYLFILITVYLFYHNLHICVTLWYNHQWCAFSHPHLNCKFLLYVLLTNNLTIFRHQCSLIARQGKITT